MMVIIVALPQITTQAITTTTTLVTTTTTTLVTTTTTTIAKTVKKVFTPVIPAAIMAMWRKVNVCEEGGRWNVRGSIYSGGLGITNYNWVQFGGQALFGPAWSATPMQQVFIARRIQAYGGVPNLVPDQYGCGHGW